MEKTIIKINNINNLAILFEMPEKQLLELQLITRMLVREDALDSALECMKNGLLIHIQNTRRN